MLPATHLLTGRVELRRIGVWRYPVYELRHDDEVIAHTGRWGWFRIYFGRGVEVNLVGGGHWRVRARTIGGYVCPLVIDGARKIAMGGPGAGADYGITCRDFGYGLFPAGPDPRSRRLWTLRLHDTDMASIRLNPLAADMAEPTHLGAVLIAFVLIRFGMPDDARPRMSPFSWR